MFFSRVGGFRCNAILLIQFLVWGERRSAHVKGFGSRPFTKGATHAGADVRNPPGKEPARGVRRGCLECYGIWPRRPVWRWRDRGLALSIAVVGERVWTGCGTGSGTRQR